MAEAIGIKASRLWMASPGARRQVPITKFRGKARRIYIEPSCSLHICLCIPCPETGSGFSRSCARSLSRSSKRSSKDRNGRRAAVGVREPGACVAMSFEV